MKSSDRMILMAVVVFFVVVGGYFFVLSPKRGEASKLDDDIVALQASIDEQEQVAAFAEQARKDFPDYYTRVVVLGKAVPEDADSASMLVQLSAISDRTGVDFRGIQLGQGGGEEAAAAAPTAPATPAPAAPAEGSTSTEATPAAATTTAAPATETAAATLPIGASVGPAGFPTLPYALDFKGRFFNVSDFIGGLDNMVQLTEKDGQVVASGRLLTVDGFSLLGGAPGSSPELKANFAVTSYVTPSTQGLTLGATPGGPAVSPAQPGTTPASVSP